MIDKIENFMNYLSDIDWGWWPVLFLRPAKDKDFDNVILIKLSLVYGSVLGAFFVLLKFLKTGMPTLGEIFYFMLLGWVLFFVVFKFPGAYFWNRRARRLRGD